MRENAMTRFDWRSPEAYESIQEVNAAGFAWEFLRRNPDYRAEVRKNNGGAAFEPESAGNFARHWGLPFRGRSRSFSGRNAGVLASHSHAVRYSGHLRAA